MTSSLVMNWFWFIFDLDNELITIIDLKIETNNTTLDYDTFQFMNNKNKADCDDRKGTYLQKFQLGLYYMLFTH